MTTTDTLPAAPPVRTDAPGVGRRVTALVAAGALAVGLLGGVGIGRLTAPAATAGVGASGFAQGGPGGAGGMGAPGQVGGPGGTTSQGGAAAQGPGGQAGGLPVAPGQDSGSGTTPDTTTGDQATSGTTTT